VSSPAPARSRSPPAGTSQQALESDNDDDHKAASPVKVKRGIVTRKPFLAAATSSPAPARSQSPLAGTSQQAVESDSDDDHKAASPVKVKRGKVTRKPFLAAAASASGHGQVDYTMIYIFFAICWLIKQVIC